MTTFEGTILTETGIIIGKVEGQYQYIRPKKNAMGDWSGSFTFPEELDFDWIVKRCMGQTCVLKIKGGRKGKILISSYVLCYWNDPPTIECDFGSHGHPPRRI